MWITHGQSAMAIKKFLILFLFMASGMATGAGAALAREYGVMPYFLPYLRTGDYQEKSPASAPEPGA